MRPRRSTLCHRHPRHPALRRPALQRRPALRRPLRRPALLRLRRPCCPALLRLRRPCGVGSGCDCGPHRIATRAHRSATTVVHRLHFVEESVHFLVAILHHGHGVVRCSSWPAGREGGRERGREGGQEAGEREGLEQLSAASGLVREAHRSTALTVSCSNRGHEGARCRRKPSSDTGEQGEHVHLPDGSLPPISRSSQKSSVLLSTDFRAGRRAGAAPAAGGGSCGGCGSAAAQAPAPGAQCCGHASLGSASMGVTSDESVHLYTCSAGSS